MSADDLKYIVVLIMFMTKLLQSDSDRVKNWCFENGMILKTTIISFKCKTISINFVYKL
jgi:hypothetical protein